jgi:prepilin-type N-terminal cleavage/methylation domain-containing protein
MKNNSGFTLVEMLIATMISVMALAGTMVLLITGLETWTVGATEVRLDRSAGLLLEKIVRGPNGQSGLRAAGATDVTIDAGQAGITFLVDKNVDPTYTITDDTQVRIYLDGAADLIMYDPDTSVAGDEFPLNREDDVSNIAFTQTGGMVDIELLMSDTVLRSQRVMQTRFETSVFLRKE